MLAAKRCALHTLTLMRFFLIQGRESVNTVFLSEAVCTARAEFPILHAATKRLSGGVCGFLHTRPGVSISMSARSPSGAKSKTVAPTQHLHCSKLLKARGHAGSLKDVVYAKYVAAAFALLRGYSVALF